MGLVGDRDGSERSTALRLAVEARASDCYLATSHRFSDFVGGEPGVRRLETRDLLMDLHDPHGRMATNLAGAGGGRFVAPC